MFACTVQENFSAIFQKRQIKAYRKVRAMPFSSPVRRVICNEIGNPIIWNHHKKRGRPRQTWSAPVHKLLAI